MRIMAGCSRPVFVAYPDQPLALTARERRAHDVGALVVVARAMHGAARSAS